MKPLSPLPTLLAVALLTACGGSADPPADEPASRPAAAAEPAREAAPASEEPEGPTWIFEGELVDLLRETGVGEATLVFENPFLVGVGTHRTTTSYSGSYRIELPALGESGYNARVEHPAYDGRNIWTSQVLESSRAERLLLGTGIQAQPIGGSFRGDDGFSTWLDLHVMPIQLTDEERRERSDAMRRLRGGGGP